MAAYVDVDESDGSIDRVFLETIWLDCRSTKDFPGYFHTTYNALAGRFTIVTRARVH